MRSLPALRQSHWWRELTAEQISPTATLLPGTERSWRRQALEFLAFSAFMGGIALLPGAESTALAQWAFYPVALAVLPSCALAFARRRWGPNSAPALMVLPLAVVAFPNVFVATLLGQALPAVKDFVGTAFWAFPAVAAGLSALYWLMLFWRARVVYRMRQEADYQKARADTAERDRQALEARLVTLKAQIEPSFLSDTMRNVQHLVQHQPAEAAVMLTNLILELTGHQQTQQELLHQARVDPLTGLPNRRAFEELLEQAHKRAIRDSAYLVMLFLDLNDFKRINDTLGHAIGDAVLRAFAERVRAAVREVDVVARFGGDEFVVLLERPEAPEAADTVVRKIETTLAPPLAIGDGEISVRASIGVARCLASTTTPLQLLEVADAAMYEDKARRKRGLLPNASTNVTAKLE